MLKDTINEILEERVDKIDLKDKSNEVIANYDGSLEWQPGFSSRYKMTEANEEFSQKDLFEKFKDDREGYKKASKEMKKKLDKVQKEINELTLKYKKQVIKAFSKI